MICKKKQSGLTLTEMAVVIGIAALLVGLTIPAVNMLLNSFESESGAKSMISAALASARAIAAKEQRYAGIRFQKRYDSVNPLNAPQYMIFIVYDTDIPNQVPGNLGCRAVEGIMPIKLPDTIGVMDSNAANDFAIDTDPELSNNTTFSIIFSPSGKLVMHSLWVRNRNGVNNNNSPDDVFNSFVNVVNNNIGMFIQDEPAYIEDSRSSFYIYETKILKQTNQNFRWTNYLSRLKPIYINSYTGTLIEQ